MNQPDIAPWAAKAWYLFEKGDDCRALDVIFWEIDQMMHTGKWEELDLIISRVTPPIGEPHEVDWPLGFLCASLAGKREGRLPSYVGLAERCYQEWQRTMPPERVQGLLRGLRYSDDVPN